MSRVFRSFCIYVYLRWHDLQDRLWQRLWHDQFAKIHNRKGR